MEVKFSPDSSWPIAELLTHLLYYMEITVKNNPHSCVCEIESHLACPGYVAIVATDFQMIKENEKPKNRG